MFDIILEAINVDHLVGTVIGVVASVLALGAKKLVTKVDEHVAGTPHEWDDEAWAKVKDAVRAALKDD